jgi:signal transduction histidine kinase/tetratricopeptide (TPR) repeat protein
MNTNGLSVPQDSAQTRHSPVLNDRTMARSDFQPPAAFVANSEVWALERRLGSLPGSPRVAGLVELAWHLRQRDTARALALLDEADALTRSNTLTLSSSPNNAARTLLIRAEAQRLFGELGSARELVESALQIFELARDWNGCSDANSVLAVIENSEGNAQRALDVLHAAFDWAKRGLDEMRCAHVEVHIAYREAFIEPEGAEARWAVRLREFIPQGNSLRYTYSHDCFAQFSFSRGDYGVSAREGLQAFDCATEFGQIDRAVVAAANISSSFSNLNDVQARLEWAQRGLELARSTAWPVMISNSLSVVAQCLSALGDDQAADAMVCSAIEKLEGNPSNPTHATLLRYKADYAPRLGDPKTSLELYAVLQAMPGSLDAVDMFLMQEGLASAYAAMGDSVNAIAAAHRAQAVLSSGVPNAAFQVDALTLLADLHIQFDEFALPDGRKSASAALHHLTQAIDIAREIDGYLVHPDLLKRAAEQYARMGEYRLAYESALAAGQARELSRSRDAKHLAVAMQVRHETERARADGEHHRLLASVESRRAEVFAQNIDVLNQLGAIGQEVTAQLDSGAVFAALDRHVHQMLDASSFSIMLMDEDEQSLTLAFGVELGRTLPPIKLNMNSVALDSVRCVRERRELALQYEDDKLSPNHVQGTLNTLSALFSPLIVGDKVLGVMTIQSPRAQAYSEREQLIFRNLCAYGAIALANARAYLQLGEALGELREAQAELVRKGEVQARMNADRDATLSFLAHDLRAPLSAIVTLLDQLPERPVVSKVERFAHRALSMTDRFLDAARLSQPTVHQDEALELASVVDDASDTFVQRAASEGKSLESSLSFGPTIKSRREELTRALCNLIDNALKCTPAGAAVVINMRPLAGWVELSITDRGPGLPDSARQLLVDPDSARASTEPGRMGLAIVANVMREHRARISVKTSGLGSCIALAFERTDHGGSSARASVRGAEGVAQAHSG